jgi:hypothetical protein
VPWEHVNLTGSYSWDSVHRYGPDQLRPLQEMLSIRLVRTHAIVRCPK